MTFSYVLTSFLGIDERDFRGWSFAELSALRYVVDFMTGNGRLCGSVYHWPDGSDFPIYTIDYNIGGTILDAPFALLSNRDETVSILRSGDLSTPWVSLIARIHYLRFVQGLHADQRLETLLQWWNEEEITEAETTLQKFVPEMAWSDGVEKQLTKAMKPKPRSRWARFRNWIFRLVGTTGS